jgi:hypothetical protein
MERYQDLDKGFLSYQELGHPLMRVESTVTQTVERELINQTQLLNPISLLDSSLLCEARSQGGEEEKREGRLPKSLESHKAGRSCPRPWSSHGKRRRGQGISPSGIATDTVCPVIIQSSVRAELLATLLCDDVTC